MRCRVGNCKDCKHWEASEFVYVMERDLGVGHCLMAEKGFPKTKAMAMYQHDEPCLVTAPDFGCIQFEAKECAA
jgi:hypothetical protein